MTSSPDMGEKIEPCLPCPFCNESDARLRHGPRQIECRRCGMEGPTASADGHAVEKWNRVASLRARAEDLELMLRATLDERAFIDFNTSQGWWLVFRTRDVTRPLKIVVPDDGTGLPLLNDAARAALKGGG